MILREATKDDLRPAAELCETTWATTTPSAQPGAAERLKTSQKRGVRIIVLWHEGKVRATLGALPLQSERGPGFEIIIFVVDLDHPDRLTFLDAISLYAMNIGLSEGRHVVHTRRSKGAGGWFFARDFLGMETEDFTDEIHHWGESKAMMERIFERHPEWRTSLTFTT